MLPLFDALATGHDRFALPAGNPAYRTAILVQRGKGGAIVAAAPI